MSISTDFWLKYCLSYMLINSKLAKLLDLSAVIVGIHFDLIIFFRFWSWLKRCRTSYLFCCTLCWYER